MHPPCACTGDSRNALIHFMVTQNLSSVASSEQISKNNNLNLILLAVFILCFHYIFAVA